MQRRKITVSQPKKLKRLKKKKALIKQTNMMAYAGGAAAVRGMYMYAEPN